MHVSKPPKGLSPEARKWWRLVTSDWALDESQLLVLETALESLDRVRQAQAQVAQDGLVLKNEKTGAVVGHPSLRLEKDAKNQMLRAWKQLNLDVEPPGSIGRPPGGRRR